MPYDMPVASQKTLSRVRARPQPTHDSQSGTARASARDNGSSGADDVRRIEPFLLVHRERIETFRLIAAAVRRGFRALARSFAA
jgi:hypothetical protein